MDARSWGVGGLTDEQEARLAFESQVNANCSNPVEPAYPFHDLTFRQIQEVLEVINNGLMTAFENGRLNYDDEPTIRQYSINLLRPLEHTYTGGSGEQYAYELVNDGVVDGEHSPEDCLNRALQSISQLITIDGIDAPTESDVYEYLKKYRRKIEVAPLV